jgi:hypothetical protein
MYKERLAQAQAATVAADRASRVQPRGSKGEQASASLSYSQVARDCSLAEQSSATGSSLQQHQQPWQQLQQSGNCAISGYGSSHAASGSASQRTRTRSPDWGSGSRGGPHSGGGGSWWSGGWGGGSGRGWRR